MVIIALAGTQPTDLDRILQSSRAAALILAVIAVATAPLVEEMIYRGRSIRRCREWRVRGPR